MTEDAPGAGRPGRPGLAEVAALAGVSKATASRALNGEGHVAHDTRQRVHQAADQLQYRRNSVARDLRRGSNTSTLIGMLAGELSNPFYSKIATGLQRTLWAHGLQLVMVSAEDGTRTEADLIGTLLDRRVRGLVIASTLAEHSHLAAEHRHGIPLVFVDRPPVGLSADAVLLDNHGGARQAAAHLLEHGHTRIGIVSDLSRLSTHRDRVAAFGATLEHAGLLDWRDLLFADARDAAAAQRAVTELLDRSAPPTAIFTTNNRITTAAVRILQGHPSPPAVIGFDDLDLGDVLDVTTIAHDPQHLGQETARLLLERLDGHTGPARWLILPTRLIARTSTRRSPARN